MRKKINIFYTTCGSRFESRRFARKLLIEKKALCVNIIKNVESYYNENGKIKTSDEIVLIIKTFLSRQTFEKFLRKNHPYDIPFLTQLVTTNVNKEYLEWAKKTYKT